MIERLGTIAGIIGAFLVALGFPPIGFPFFFISSVCLTYSAWKQGNRNLISLQAAFLCCNILGLWNWSL